MMITKYTHFRYAIASVGQPEKTSNLQTRGGNYSSGRRGLSFDVSVLKIQKMLLGNVRSQSAS